MITGVPGMLAGSSALQSYVNGLVSSCVEIREPSYVPCLQPNSRTIPNRLDVGVDGNDFRPWSFEQIKEHFAKQTPK